MNRWIRVGLRELARGARAGTPGLAGLGAFMFGVGLIKRFTRPKQALIYSRRLRPGKGVRIRMIGSDEELDIIA